MSKLVKFKKDYSRVERLQETIKQTLAEIFVREKFLYNNCQEFSVIIEKVSLSADLKQAKVFIRPFNKPDVEKTEFINMFNNLSFSFFKKLSKILKIKYTPKLIFYYDETFEYCQNLDRYFKSSFVSQE